MKAADIPDETFLAIVREFNEGRAPDKRVSWPNHPDWLPDVITGPRWCLIWDLQERLPDFPEKVIRAKARQLIKRGLLDGCTCGCRGDFELPEYGGRVDPDFIREAIAATERRDVATA